LLMSCLGKLIGAAAVVAAFALPASAQTSTFQTRVEITHSRDRREHSRDENVVVWLQPLDHTTAELKPAQNEHRYDMVQRDKQFHPHVLAVPVGSAVVFPNDDPFFHNVFSLYQGKRFDLGLYEAGSSRSVRFDKPGVSFIFCNIHPEMNAYLVALDTPYFTVTRNDGIARIAGDPSYSIVARDCEVRRIQCNQVGIHLGMNIAKDE